MNLFLAGRLLFALGSVSLGPVPCDDLTKTLDDELNRTSIAMEPESGLASIYDQATRATESCPDSEELAYLRLRAAELGRGAPVGRQTPPASEEWRKLAPVLLAKFPRSVKIATVQARASGTVSDARHALALDRTYLPARVALAAALLSSSPAEAATYLAPEHDLATVSDGYTVLARTRWALGDSAGATEAAKLALHARAFHLIEPDARDPRPVAGAHEVLGQVLLAKCRFREAATHLKLAATDSSLARNILANPPPGLQKVLQSRRKGGVRP